MAPFLGCQLGVTLLLLVASWRLHLGCQVQSVIALRLFELGTTSLGLLLVVASRVYTTVISRQPDVKSGLLIALNSY